MNVPYLWITSLLFDLNYEFINGSFAFSPGYIYILIFQDKLHSVNIQDDQSWALSETFQKFLKSPVRPVGSRFYSASRQRGRVFE